MASLGVRTVDELIGRSDLLVADRAVEHWKARGVDLTHVLHRPELPEGTPLRRLGPPPAVLEDALDWELIRSAEPALQRGERVEIETKVRNVNRCVGGLLSSHIARERGADGLPEGSIHVELTGSAGQSFGGWLAPGVSFRLHGDANDYTGKGLSGGVLAVLPPDGVTYAAEHNVIVGNTVLYGATSGKAFFRGLAGERFGGAQLGRERRRRGRRRPRLRVHDRRARRRARPHRAQLRGGHERRAGLRARRGRRPSARA